MNYIKFEVKIDILTKGKIRVKSLNEEATELRNEWLKKMGQLDSDILFFAFLIKSPNTSDNQTITKSTTTYTIEIDPRDLPDAFNYITIQEE